VSFSFSLIFKIYEIFLKKDLKKLELKALIPGYAPAPDRRAQLMPQQQQHQQQQSHDHEQQEFTGRAFYVEQQQLMPQMQGMQQQIKSRKPQQH
jgi:hypothetical protein